MILLPVIERELRAAARHPFTYHLRVLSVAALLIAFILFALEGNLGPGVGQELFRWLHATLFLAIWVLVPLLTADVISRERREGTLPLLFLTPLQPRDIVYAKGLAHGLRAFTLWLAVVPVLTVSILAGGVSWAEVVISALINFSSVCLALGAGLVASARTRIWTGALAWALGLAFCFLLAFLTVFPWLLQIVAQPFAGGGLLAGSFEWTSPGDGLALAVNARGLWQNLLSSSRFSGPGVWGFACVAVAALGFFLLLVRFAAWNVNRAWREEPPSARVLWLNEKLCQPVVFQRGLRRWLNWQLQHNPIGWLEQRSWRGRLVVWSWFAVVLCIYSSLFANLQLYQRGFHGMQVALASLLAGSIALSASGSFRRERETGVLELLLVAPLREWQIIGGRVRGLWAQFLPAAVLLCVVWLFGSTFLGGRHEMHSVVLYAVTFATLPVVGLYFSLAKPNFIVALLWTLLLQMAVPHALAQGCEGLFAPLGFSYNSEERTIVGLLVPVAFQILSALFLAWRLHTNLKGRKFALESKGL